MVNLHFQKVDIMPIFGPAAGVASDVELLFNRVIVKTATDLAGTLDSAKEYFIDGVIDMGLQQIEIPTGGLNLTGYNFDLSQLVSSEDNYTMFTSPVGGSGNLLGKDYTISTSGTNSKVYDIKSATGDEAFEFARINYVDCTSLGVIDTYRQGLEIGSGRFGGTPSLELKGAWAGGYRITTSIVRGVSDLMAEPFFKAGTGFIMQSRFLTDINIDLGALAALTDFAPANFPNPSTLQIQEAIITRNGVSDADDPTIAPNISMSDLSSLWRDNNGLTNTIVGGTQVISVEAETVISVIDTFVDVAGTWDASNLQHFDAPANGQLRHLGDTPRDFFLFGDVVAVSGASDVLNLKLVKWDDSASSFVDITTQTRQVNTLPGPRNVAFFNAQVDFTLDKNDFVKLQMSNSTSTTNITVEFDSFTTVKRS